MDAQTYLSEPQPKQTQAFLAVSVQLTLQIPSKQRVVNLNAREIGGGGGSRLRSFLLRLRACVARTLGKLKAEEEFGEQRLHLKLMMIDGLVVQPALPTSRFRPPSPPPAPPVALTLPLDGIATTIHRAA